jgi:3-phosphoglycerate kinase
MKSVKEINDISGKIFFVRVDFNVPVLNSKVLDTFRIEKAFKTIDYLKSKDAKIILASHIDGEGANLRPVFEYLKEKYPLVFVEDYFPNTPDIINNALELGSIVLLDNLRKYPEEKENDDTFARHIASFADYYVNDAFAVSHRIHASVVKITEYLPSFAGFEIENEVKELSKAFHPPEPFLFILGGAKFETKLPLIKKFFDLANFIFIGGALANDFFRAKGYSTGKSLLSEGGLDLKDFLNDKLILPYDVKVKNAEGVFVKQPEDLLVDDYIVDVGPETIEKLANVIEKSKFILWNGPLGNYEMGFKDATLSLAQKIASAEGASIVGGGDTIASIAELELWDKFSFISTGGGAMLDFLANETLPGITALEQSKNILK